MSKSNEQPKGDKQTNEEKAQEHGDRFLNALPPDAQNKMKGIVPHTPKDGQPSFMPAVLEQRLSPEAGIAAEIGAIGNLAVNGLQQ